MEARVLTEAGFAPAGEAEWRRLVDKALKGAAFDTALVTISDDGIAYGPIGLRDRDGAPHMRGEPNRPWTIIQRIDDRDEPRAAAQIAADVDGGATGLAVCITGAASAYGFGVPSVALPACLDSIPATAELHFEAPAGAIAAVLDSLANRSASKRLVHLGLAPHRDMAGGGHLDEAAILPLLERAFQADGLATILSADGRIAHNAGASEAQELAIVLAAAVEMMRIAERAGIAPDTALPATHFALAADQDQFLTIAKFRALRRLHRHLQDALGVSEPRVATIHAETSWRMLTRRDPETNILRNTVAVVAAGLGGADSIAVLPHTLAHGLPDRFARRIARNTQAVLIEESHLAFVSDPAAGAGGIEDLTAALAEKAWGEFQRIESEGGLARSLGQGVITERVTTIRRRRAEAQAAGQKPLVGATIFPPDSERPVGVLAPRPASPVETGVLAPVSLEAEATNDGAVA